MAQELLVTEAGSYTVRVTNGLGCQTLSSPHVVTVNPLPEPVISGPATVCLGGSVILNAGAGYSSYLWSPGGEMTQAITVSPALSTAYRVTVTNAGGCQGVATSHLVSVWTPPSPAQNLQAAGSATTTLTWDPPSAPGGGTLIYDVLRSESPSDFTTATCIASDLTERTASDADPVGSVFYYLIRARNECGENLGTRSDGTPRTGADCP